MALNFLKVFMSVYFTIELKLLAINFIVALIFKIMSVLVFVFSV
jgi:hypothetical protein